MTVTVRINFASRAYSLPLSPPIDVRRMDLPKDSMNKPNTYKKSFFPPLLKNNNKKENTDFMYHFSPFLGLLSVYNTEGKKKNPLRFCCQPYKEIEHSRSIRLFPPVTGCSSFSCLW